MNRTEKEEQVASLRQVFDTASLLVVTHQNGLTVAEVNALRRRMLEAGGAFKVTKNRLARIALEGSKFQHLSGLFKGPTAIAYSTDPVAAAKVAVGYAKDNDKLSILGGGLDQQTLDAKGVTALATLPSLDELRAKLAGMLKTPATRIAVVLQAPASQVARVVGAYAAKSEAA